MKKKKREKPNEHNAFNCPSGLPSNHHHPNGGENFAFCILSYVTGHAIEQVITCSMYSCSIIYGIEGILIPSFDIYYIYYYISLH